MNSEVPGLVPTTDYYKRTAGGFQKGVLLNTAIGQGDTKVTVLQLAMVYAAIANGGKLWVPQIVERVQTADGQVGCRSRLVRRDPHRPGSGEKHLERGVEQRGMEGIGREFCFYRSRDM